MTVDKAIYGNNYGSTRIVPNLYNNYKGNFKHEMGSLWCYIYLKLRNMQSLS